MRMVRHRLAWFAGGWLLSQLAVLTVTPSALRVEMPSAVASAQCTCSHGDVRACPMHHTTSNSKTRSCSCRSATDTAAAVIASLFGPAAVLTVPIDATEPAARLQRPVRLESRPLDSDLVPDAPPPRA